MGICYRYEDFEDVTGQNEVGFVQVHFCGYTYILEKNKESSKRGKQVSILELHVLEIFMNEFVLFDELMAATF